MLSSSSSLLLLLPPSPHHFQFSLSLPPSDRALLFRVHIFTDVIMFSSVWFCFVLLWAFCIVICVNLLC